MLRCRHYLPLGHLHVLPAARDDEDGLFASDGSLDVGVCFGAQGLNLTAWR